MRILFLTFTIIFLNIGHFVYSASNDSVSISILSDFLKNEPVKLGYYYGTKSFLKDSIFLNLNGKALYKGNLHKGIYFIVLADSSVCEFMIDEGNQVTIEIEKNKFRPTCNFKGNPVTEAYDTYQKKMSAIFDNADSTNKTNSNSAVKIINPDKNKLTDIQKENIKKLQKATADLFPGSLLQTYLNALLPVEVSTIRKTYQKDNDTLDMLQTLRLYRQHYLDNLNLNDERLIYTPVFSEKINYYFDKIVSQHPDSIIAEMLKTYSLIENQQVRKFFLESQLDKYKHQCSKAKQELVYFSIIENFYLTGKANWESTERIAELTAELNRIKPSLLFQTATEINLPGISDKIYSLSATDANYTLLIFWDLDCPLCMRIIKDLNKTISPYNYLSIQVFTICINNDFTKWSGVTVKNLPQTWINTIQMTSHGPSDVYNISKTPTLYLLDKDKKIIQKNFTNSELENILLKIATNQTIN